MIIKTLRKTHSFCTNDYIISFDDDFGNNIDTFMFNQYDFYSLLSDIIGIIVYGSNYIIKLKETEQILNILEFECINLYDFICSSVIKNIDRHIHITLL